MGSPAFAAPSLMALIEAGHDIRCVYSQPPKPAGRGKALRSTVVSDLARDAGLPLRTPRSLRSPEEIGAFAALELDAAVVVAYGLILPPAILDAPRLGCFNLHASLLPRWRGAAPIQRAIMAGDRQTGVQVMKMDAGLDTGPVMLSERTMIASDDTAGVLQERLSRMGASLLVEAMKRLERGDAALSAQSTEGITYAAKIESHEARIDWTAPAEQVSAAIRGLSPSPGAWFLRDAVPEPVRIKVLNAVVATGSGPPGLVLDDGLRVACGVGAVRLTVLQRAGKGPMVAEAFQQGARIVAGERFS
jgi:methionyl-tRNA formyltransferase